jgi:WD40 repeat protein
MPTRTIPTNRPTNALNSTRIPQPITLGLLLALLALVLCDESYAQNPPGNLESPKAPLTPDPNPYADRIQPILAKYCVACHSHDAPESNLKLLSLASMTAGGDSGPALIPSNPSESLILRRILGLDEPKMPPEDSAQPTAEEIETIKRWIEQGALGSDPSNSLADRWKRIAPNSKPNSAITAAAPLNPKQSLVGKFAQIELVERSDTPSNPTRILSVPFLGKISQIRLDRDAKHAAIAGGIPGLGGIVHVLDLDQIANLDKDPSSGKRIEAHSDVLYCAALHPKQPWVATAGYDRTIRLWDYNSGKLLRSFEGHNGAVYDLDFDPSGDVLASASADETIKVWRTDSGLRLDTLGQGEAEQLRVRFLDPTTTNNPTENDRSICLIATGADRRIRQWRLPSLDQPSVSPMLHSVFAHEATIHQLALSPNHLYACTAAQDGTIKVWNTQDWQLIDDLPPSKELLTSLAWTHDSTAIEWTTLEGSIRQHSIADAIRSFKEKKRSMAQATSAPPQSTLPPIQPDPPSIQESDAGPRSVQNPQLVVPPVRVQATLETQDLAHGGDWYAFESKQGQVWSIAVSAAQDKSPLDSYLEITDPQANPILRTRLQAVRESYYTFRGKDSLSIDDFRLHRWEDMQLNEWLYSGGEVVRLWLYPRGPDSGFKVYPGFGNRFTYFGTSPIAHALNEPAWIVRELAPDQPPVSNGLPVFPVFYSNDDDPMRKFGKDSNIEFLTPYDGRFLIRLRDTRGQSGPDYRYRLSIVPPNPRFDFKLETNELTLRPDVGSEFIVSIDRFDGLDEDVQIEFEDPPEGIRVIQPLTIEKGQLKAIGQIRALSNKLSELPKEFEITLKAKCQLGNQERIAEQKPKLKIKVNPKPTMTLKIVGKDDPDEAPPIEKLHIRPGQTVSAKLVIQRGELAGDIAFGGDDSGRNLPHGCFVDNIGLNGLLIPAGESTREVFITAAPIVQPQRRVFHLRGNVDGNPTSLPVELIVE